MTDEPRRPKSPHIRLYAQDGKPVLGADFYNLFGARVKQMRKERGLTAVQMAKESGVPRDTINVIEKHGHKPRLDELLKLCQYLEVSPNWLLYGSDSVNYARHVQANLITKKGEIDITEQLIRMSFFYSMLSPHERSAVNIMLTGMLRGSGRTDEDFEAIHRTADSMADALSHNPFLNPLIRALAQDPHLLPRIEAELAKERAEAENDE